MRSAGARRGGWVPPQQKGAAAAERSCHVSVLLLRLTPGTSADYLVQTADSVALV